MNSTFALTAVRLRVSDLDRSTDFYRRRLGFKVAGGNTDGVELTTGSGSKPLLTLIKGSHSPVPPRDAAGLFHAALLFSSRSALGGWLNFAAAQGLDFEGFSDHGVSEAIYLSDPDGNGLEFYADRPKDTWPYSKGEVAMTTRPLALRSLLADASPTADAPLEGAKWGHLHLRVTDLDQSEAFYRERLGLAVTQRSYPGARFMAADGYHHHLGLNTWGNPQHSQPAEALGLVEATFARAGVVTEESLVDPDGIHVKVQSALVPA